MFSIYQTTKQGETTRSQLLAILRQQDGLTRNEIVQASQGLLSYEQVRRQTDNLRADGILSSCTTSRQKRYYLRQNFIPVP